MKSAARYALLGLSACSVPALATTSLASPSAEQAPQPPGLALAAPPPSTDCRQVRECARLIMQAALREDIDMASLIATRIDLMPKPEAGHQAAARKLYQQALTDLQRGDADHAATLLRAALRENPRDADIASHLGLALLKASRTKEAVEALTQALLLDPRRASTWSPLGEALARQGETTEAAAALWTGWLWSSNRAKTLRAYQDKALREATRQPMLAKVYAGTLSWINEGQRPTHLAGRQPSDSGTR